MPPTCCWGVDVPIACTTTALRPLLTVVQGAELRRGRAAAAMPQPALPLWLQHGCSMAAECVLFSIASRMC